MTVSLLRHTLAILLGAALCACAETPDARDGGSGAIEDGASDAQADETRDAGDGGSDAIMDGASDAQPEATHDGDVVGDADTGRCPEDPFAPFGGLQNPIPGCPCPTPGEQYCWLS